MKQSSLFDPPRERPTGPAIRVNIDGGARGNPGPAAYGVVVRDASGRIIDEIAEYLGIQTNNFAEYSGLLAALEYALREKCASLKVLSDSELLVKQMKGQYRVKNPGLMELYERARAMVRKLQYFSIDHVLRESNREADRLVNKVLDSQSGGMRR
ncbi:MAG TPA: ribonuclease HI family protein [Candidatus Angelobacter sp.]|nr:ribonuclease HI family protein [Candidatus Angelobacter sp.]